MPTLEATLTATGHVTQTRTIAAPRARVYDAWTDPELLMLWFGPTNMYCPYAALDARAGGKYRIDVRPEGAVEGGTSATGAYTRVVPNERLEFTWIPSWLAGEESRVTVAFHDAPGGTELALRHENFDESCTGNYNKGWSGSLDKLAQFLATN